MRTRTLTALGLLGAAMLVNTHATAEDLGGFEPPPLPERVPWTADEAADLSESQVRRLAESQSTSSVVLEERAASDLVRTFMICQTDDDAAGDTRALPSALQSALDTMRTEPLPSTLFVSPASLSRELMVEGVVRGDVPLIELALAHLRHDFELRESQHVARLIETGDALIALHESAKEGEIGGEDRLAFALQLSSLIEARRWREAMLLSLQQAAALGQTGDANSAYRTVHEVIDSLPNGGLDTRTEPRVLYAALVRRFFAWRGASSQLDLDDDQRCRRFVRLSPLRQEDPWAGVSELRRSPTDERPREWGESSSDTTILRFTVRGDELIVRGGPRREKRTIAWSPKTSERLAADSVWCDVQCDEIAVVGLKDENGHHWIVGNSTRAERWLNWLPIDPRRSGTLRRDGTVSWK